MISNDLLVYLPAYVGEILTCLTWWVMISWLYQWNQGPSGPYQAMKRGFCLTDVQVSPLDSPGDEAQNRLIRVNKSVKKSVPFFFWFVSETMFPIDWVNILTCINPSVSEMQWQPLEMSFTSKKMT